MDADRISFLTTAINNFREFGLPKIDNLTKQLKEYNEKGLKEETAQKLIATIEALNETLQIIYGTVQSQNTKPISTINRDIQTGSADLKTTPIRTLRK